MRCLLTDRSIIRARAPAPAEALALPPEPGTYALILRCAVERPVWIGRLGSFTTRKGWYLYVGSAFGPGDIRARVNHHLKPSMHPHWHLDYLRPAVDIIEIWYSNEPQRREHQWATQLLEKSGGDITLRGFGSADCRCETHLVFCQKLPALP